MLPKGPIYRLLKYKRILVQLKSLGLERVFANNLGDALGINSTLVRKDFSMFNIQGNKKGGYVIDELIQQLTDILGNDEGAEIIIVGCGRIGSALIHYKDFKEEGILISAAFDIKPERAGDNPPVPVYPLDKLEEYVKERNVKIGIITVPDNAATGVQEIMIKAGIKGILNFAPVELKSSPACVVNNVNIGLEIENLIFQVTMNAKEEREDLK